MAHKLWFDTETTGLDNENCILTAYFCIMDENDNFIDELDMLLKPDDLTTLKVTKEAMKVTGINLKEHLMNKDTITHSEGEKLLELFLKKHKIKGKRVHYIPCGQNIEFDIRFVKKDLAKESDTWNKMVGYKTLDTLRVLTFLQDCDILPKDLGNLGSLVDYFGIKMGVAHDAKEDVKMTIAVYMQLKKLMKSFKKQSGGLPPSLLDVIER